MARGYGNRLYELMKSRFVERWRGECGGALCHAIARTLGDSSLLVFGPPTGTILCRRHAVAFAKDLGEGECVVKAHRPCDCADVGIGLEDKTPRPFKPHLREEALR